MNISTLNHAIARALSVPGLVIGTPACAHCHREIRHDGRRWRHYDRFAACPNGTTEATPKV